MQGVPISINLRRLREVKGLTQAQLADKAGISRLGYANIENGRAEPKVSTLRRIADALGVRLQDLVAPVPTLRSVRFRARKRLSGRDRSARAQIVVDIAQWLEDFNYLERILDYQPVYSLPSLRDSLREVARGKERAVLAACRARKAFSLDEDDPVRDICGLLEHHGVKVLALDSPLDWFFGLSVSHEDGGPAVAVNTSDHISVERWIFSTAHELGHLILHEDAYDVNDTAENEQEEMEANVFASFFLMPPDLFDREWEETAGLRFALRVFKVKRMFRVSYKTVLVRLQDRYGQRAWSLFASDYARLGRSPLHARCEPDALGPDSFWTTPVESHRTHEPENLTRSDFVEDRLARLVKTALERGEISASRGAEILRIDIEAMRDHMSSWSAEARVN